MHGVASIVGALIMYGIGNTDTHLASWRVLFLICGGLTIAVGLIFIFVMPQDTKTAWFLNERERAVATQRLALDRATRDKTDFNMGQFKEAILSPRTWLFFFMAMFITFPTPIVKVSRSHLEQPSETNVLCYSSLLLSSKASDTLSSRPCSSDSQQAPSRLPQYGSAL